MDLNEERVKQVMESNIHSKVTLVISVIDDVTNRILKDGSIRVGIPGEREPILKEEGYFVFINQSKIRGKVIITSHIYLLTEIEFDLTKNKALEPIMARVYPNQNYPFPEPVNKEMYYSKGMGKNYRLLADYNAYDKETNLMLQIHHEPGIRLDEKVLWIHETNGMGGEPVYIGRGMEVEKRRYQIKNKLLKNYKKTDVILQTVFPGRINAVGRYGAPLPYMGNDVDFNDLPEDD